MKKLNTTFATILFIAVAVTGCKKKGEPAPEPTKTAPAAGSGSAAATTGTTATAVTPAAAADVPASTDFEDQANKDITADNLDSQLADLEKDLAK